MQPVGSDERNPPTRENMKNNTKRGRQTERSFFLLIEMLVVVEQRAMRGGCGGETPCTCTHEQRVEIKQAKNRATEKEAEDRAQEAENE